MFSIEKMCIRFKDGTIADISINDNKEIVIIATHTLSAEQREEVSEKFKRMINIGNEK